MKLKTFIALSLIATSTFCFGQETNNQETSTKEKKKPHFGYQASLGVGSSNLEHNKLGTLTGNVYAFRFNVDFGDEDLKFISGVEALGCNSGFFDGTKQSTLQNSYLQVPLKMIWTINLDKEEKLNLVSGIGTYVNFLLESAIYSNGDKTNTKSGGVNMGYNLLLGLKYKLSSETSIGINADIMSEFSAISKNGYEQRQTGIYLFSVGFSRKF